MSVVRALLATGALVCAVSLLSACEDDQAKVVKAAAEMASRTRVLGPNDLQILSLDRTTGLEVIGDSVHVFLANSTISVPATHIENVRYADNRLRFDIRGLGTKIFEVGDGTEGAVFRQADALQFVAFVVQRQNEIESRDAKTP
ncbi:MAG: hypothetical protein ACK6DP_14395 [Gemmatimonas sp.]|jgi:hypothetical protein|uniref:hypothetical protein n=1 Tax=Gemmatimonas sp. TaxID=1962908 RepID=UPI00391F4330|nr:hypothetical protein [Gemmatimonadota bacterium]